MSQQNKDVLTDHAYDGIQEYDNPTPGWWSAIFIASIVFAFLYWAIATISGGGLSAEKELAFDKLEETQKQFGELGELTADSATILKFATDEKWRAVGEGIYLSKCSACHNRDGTGITGPNLTDDFYINVKTPTDIHDVIANGRNNGAMPAWKTTLNENEIIMASAYVAGLRGQNKSGKAVEPNATKIDPWTSN